MAKSLRISLRLGANATEIECKSHLYALECNNNERMLRFGAFILRLRPLNASRIECSAGKRRLEQCGDEFEG